MCKRPEGLTAVKRVRHLWVDDDLQVHGVLLMQPLDGGQRDPQVVGVEDLELGDRLELVDVGLWYLRDLQQPQVILVLDQSTTLQRGDRKH